MKATGPVPISFPEAVILLVKRRGSRLLALTSGQVQHRKSAIHGLPVTLRMPSVKSDKSVWFWSQSIVFTKPFKTGMSLDLVRGPDFQRMTKGTSGDEVGPVPESLHRPVNNTDVRQTVKPSLKPFCSQFAVSVI